MFHQKQILADEPSRLVDIQDTMLSRETWGKVEDLFGPHTVDLMACDSNVMEDTQGQPLAHFTRYPSPGSAGVNMFAQDIHSEENPYVFPLLSLFYCFKISERTGCSGLHFNCTKISTHPHLGTSPPQICTKICMYRPKGFQKCIVCSTKKGLLL